jgi:hypothetical protein
VYNSSVIKNLISLQAICIALVLSVPVWSEQGAAIQAGPMVGGSNGNVASYEVISIRLNKSAGGGGGRGFFSGGLDYRGIKLTPLISDAFGIADQSQIYGLPSWVESSFYDIQARVDSKTTEACVFSTACLRREFCRCHVVQAAMGPPFVVIATPGGDDPPGFE